MLNSLSNKRFLSELDGKNVGKLKLKLLVGLFTTAVFFSP